VCPKGLQKIGDELACYECRKLKLVPDTEAKMSEDKIGNAQKAPLKKLVELQLFEVPTSDGGVDHQVIASVKAGGVLFCYETTVDTIRKFFTERRRVAAEKRKPAA
jgi:hypothetical protein